MKQAFIKLVEKLVAFKSTADRPKERRAVLKFCQSWLENEGISVEWFEHSESPSLVATLKGNLKKTILLNAHLDVVPASEKCFEMAQKKVKEQDYLFGRGVLDDKGPVALLMLFLKEIKNKKNFPTFKLMLNTDEEVGGVDGAGRLANLPVLQDIDAVFIPDGGEKDVLVTKSKGLVHSLIKVKGKSAHGAYPWLGENAIEKAYAIFEKIKMIFENEDLSAENHWHATVNIGKFHAGEMINQVPAEAEIGVDVRFTDRHNWQEIKNRIVKIIEEGGGEILQMSAGEPLGADDKHQLVSKYRKVMGEALEVKIEIKPEHGASDARYFNRLGVPVWIHCFEGDEVHSEGEWANADSAIKMLQGLFDFFDGLEESDFSK